MNDEYRRWMKLDIVKRRGGERVNPKKKDGFLD